MNIINISELIKGRILKPKYNNTLGIQVFYCEYAFHGKWEVSVRYFNLDGSGEPTIKHSIYMYTHDILSMFDILENPQDVKSDLSGANWVPLKVIEEYLNDEKQGVVI